MVRDPLRLSFALMAAVAVLALASGCRAATHEPVSELKTMGTVDHDFKIVWECTLEALQGEGLHPERAPQRNKSGYIETQYKKIGVDPITRQETAVRARAQIIPVGGGSYDVKLSAGKFQKAAAERHWKWVGGDEALRNQLWRLFDKAVAKRYARR